MAGNPLSGHTKANMTLSGSAQPADGLTDGDHILSPTLTNFLEGIHGNGILLEEDTAYGDGDRDDPENLPGACNQQTNSYTFRVQGGLAVLDGVLYAFADGPGNSTDIVISTASTSKTGSPTALTSGQEALVVVYLSSDDNAKHVYWEMGTAVTTASNTYPTTPSAFLNAPGSLTNRNTTVLATLRAVYSATGGDYNVSISEVNDKRAFVRPSPIYFSPVTSGAVAATTAATDPDAFHSGDEAGSLAGSRVGALWQSYNADGDSLLYYSAKTDSSTRHTHVLGPSSVKALTPSTTTTFTYDESNIFVITPTSAHQFNPSGTFPKGHMVFVSNHAAHDTNGITFDSGGLGSVILGKESALFVYDGTNWKSVIFASGATSPNGHGANGAIQLSDGGGGFTSDTNLTWTASPATLTVDGKLTVTGLIDPTGMVFTPQATNPETTNPLNTIWIDSETGHLVRGNRDTESTVHFNVRNDEGATIPLGAPLYSKGEIGGSQRIKVGIADASDPAKMPAIGLAMEEMNTSSTQDGNMILTGILNENITITGVVEQDIIYVAPHGGTAPYLTITRPTSGSHLVQNVGVCVRQASANVSQGMKVAAIGRTVDIPNAVITTNSADADYVYIDDGNTFKKITPSNLGISGSAGTVTSIATTAPITGGTITSTGTIGISAATTSAAGSMSAADKTKLDGIAASATANDTDANLKNRSNHTGTQLAATISDFATAIAADPTVAANTAKQGFVNPLYFTAKVGTNTNDSTLGAGTWRKVEYWDVISNNTLALDSATDAETFTVPSGQGGLYTVHAQVGFTGTNSTLGRTASHDYQIHVAIYKNGSVLVRQGSGTLRDYSAKTSAVSTDVVLAATDTLEIYFFVRDDANQSDTGTTQLRGGEYCRWSVRRIGDS